MATVVLWARHIGQSTGPLKWLPANTTHKSIPSFLEQS